MAAVVNEVRAAGLMIFRVVHQRIEYLLLQASNFGHHWTAPKGHVDPGETDELVTAKRETEEESGLRPDDYEVIEGFLYTLRYPVNNKPKRVTYWAAKVKDPNAPITISDEHQNYRWCNLPTVFQMTDKKDMQESYQALQTFLQKLYNLNNPGN